ncbi:hypothetical protein [Pseudomonas juntendi]|uniref:hypothetical protein n=1 Tax=Pseudomonas juntendi TaxID=2666183 RepID=UPI001F49125D|nr:hypothetical protein [Pseudomonas juntendi]MCO7058281.1 hypothetical protein [Pseudomonas juntendi]UJM15253.1 hypothetical protein L1P09_25920 [Pseudomonas juntendi]
MTPKGIAVTHALVYRAPTAGRRYLSKAAAINAETRAIIKAKYPDEDAPQDTQGQQIGPAWSMEYDEPKRWAKIYRRLRRLVARSVGPVQGNLL